jgi:hypothetical protein
LKVPDLLIAPACPPTTALLALGQWARERGFASVAFEVLKPNDALVSGLRAASFVDRGNADVVFVLDKRPGSPAQNEPWYFLRADEFYNTF